MVTLEETFGILYRACVRNALCRVTEISSIGAELAKTMNCMMLAQVFPRAKRQILSPCNSGRYLWKLSRFPEFLIYLDLIDKR